MISYINADNAARSAKECYNALEKAILKLQRAQKEISSKLIGREFSGACVYINNNIIEKINDSMSGLSAILSRLTTLVNDYNSNLVDENGGEMPYHNYNQFSFSKGAVSYSGGSISSKGINVGSHGNTTNPSAPIESPVANQNSTIIDNITSSDNMVNNGNTQITNEPTVSPSYRDDSLLVKSTPGPTSAPIESPIANQNSTIIDNITSSDNTINDGNTQITNEPTVSPSYRDDSLLVKSTPGPVEENVNSNNTINNEKISTPQLTPKPSSIAENVVTDKKIISNNNMPGAPVKNDNSRLANSTPNLEQEGVNNNSVLNNKENSTLAKTETSDPKQENNMTENDIKGNNGENSLVSEKKSTNEKPNIRENANMEKSKVDTKKASSNNNSQSNNVNDYSNIDLNSIINTVFKEKNVVISGDYTINYNNDYYRWGDIISELLKRANISDYVKDITYYNKMATCILFDGRILNLNNINSFAELQTSLLLKLNA